jgi:ferrous iron transport protein B
VAVAFVLKRAMRGGPPSSFVMELPPYRRPSLRSVWLRVFVPVRAFVQQAGTIILAMAIVIWALGTFPRSDAVTEAAAVARVQAEATLEGESLASRVEAIDRAEASEKLEASALGRMGKAVAPVVAPLGWDWRIGTAAIASFPAREVVVSTLGIIYGLGDSGEETALIQKLRTATWPDGRRLFSLPVALSIMVFFALCCQCGATIATIRRETASIRWPVFVFTYMTVLAYVGALAVYQIASRL